MFLALTPCPLFHHVHQSVAQAMIVLVALAAALIHGLIVIPCAVAEIWMVGYLLIVGVRTPKADETAKPQDPVLTAV